MISSLDFEMCESINIPDLYESTDISDFDQSTLSIELDPHVFDFFIDKELSSYDVKCLLLVFF